ncbi:MAG: hypothetical protein JXA83_05995 [Acidimicrobiales bacterium]|nr:hypothetical protein [Acidimicrobiales bacterium]
MDEIYSNGGPVTDAPATPDRQASATPATPGGDVSHTRRTPVPAVADTPPPAPAPKKKSTTRTPAGKRRHSLYIDDATAVALNDAAERVGRQLGGVVPKHRVLAAIIAAGIDQAGAVAGRLRAELLDTIGQ